MNWHQLLSHKRQGDKETVPFSRGSRSQFEQDYDRLIFSHPFRRLQDKTQVFPLPEDDFVHTRLTHSLEVSSVGRSLGKAVGEKLLERHPDLGETGYSSYDFGAIVAAASLAHDIGNPPFGHSGETAISSFFLSSPTGSDFKSHVSEKEWADLIDFEGNAQGFRILNESPALKLTFATLGAFTKYPKTSHSPKNKQRKSQKKYGVCVSSLPFFTEMVAEMGLLPVDVDSWCRHPLTFLVEAADDICYSVIDLEDGCRLGLVTFEETKALFATVLGDQLSDSKLEKIQGQNEKLGLLRALAISKLVQEAVEVFLQNEEAILAGSFDQALTDCIHSAYGLERISKVSVKKIYQSKQVLEREAGGFEVMGKLMEVFCEAAYTRRFDHGNFTPRRRSVLRLMPELTQSRLEEAQSVYEALQLTIDFVSGLTDKHAIKLYRIISGISLPAH